MVKRKQAAPSKCDEDKRQRATWSMRDSHSQEETTTYALSSDDGTSAGDAGKVMVTMKDSDQLHKKLQKSQFSFSVYSSLEAKPGDWHCQLGTLFIQLATSTGDYPVLPPVDQYWAYVSLEPGESFVYFDLDTEAGKFKGKRKGVASKYEFYSAKFSLPFNALRSLQPKQCVKVVQSSYSPSSGQLICTVHLLEGGLHKLKFDSEAPRQKNASRIQLMEHFFNIPSPAVSDVPPSRHHDISLIYEAIKQIHLKQLPQVVVNAQHPSLNPSLRPYQQEAVKWMLQKEGYMVISDDALPVPSLHPLYQTVTTLDAQTLYYNKFAGILVRDKPFAKVSPPGGVLADEMGLGKTIEVLSCILTHQRTDLPQRDRRTPGAELVIPPYLATDTNSKSGTSVSMSDSTVSTCDYQVSTSDCSVSNCKTCTCLDINCDHIDPVKTNSCDGNVLHNVELLKSTAEDKPLLNPDAKIGYSSQNMESACISANVSLKASCELEPKPNTGSGVSCVVRQTNGNLRLECVCGKDQCEDDNKSRIQCTKCGLLQHPDCVHYDINDPYRGPFRCPHCHVTEAPIPSAATLIVAPQSICYQWTEEIRKHVKKERLKVFVYTGVHNQGFIQPQTLADHDIVITAYETLRSEVNYVDLPHCNSDAGRRLRRPKRFMAVPSPIVAVEWWRICLDEAQMVECTTTKTADMALRLSAVNRWCVTGTPIQRGIEDLYGLLLFLGVDPYWVRLWWTLCIQEPYFRGDLEPLYSLLSRVLWRTAKEDVLDQIQLPEQREKIYWLSFSAVEEHFYRRQFQECCQEARKKLCFWTENGHQKLNSLDRYTMNSLLQPLLRLRQACCHPQAVRGQFLPLHKSTLTMEELLHSLTHKATVECEEAHRQVVSALNGLAAIAIINEEFVEAAGLYREVLTSVDHHKDQLRTDDLQQLHALHNLHELITAHTGVIPRTLRDDQLKVQAGQLCDKYMAKAAARVNEAKIQLENIQATCREHKQELHVGDQNWWLGILVDVRELGGEEELMERVKNELSSNVGLRFRNLQGLQLVIHNHLQSLESFHSELLISIHKLCGNLSLEVISKTVECCLRPADGEVKNSCSFCMCHKIFEEYETYLFHFNQRMEHDGEKHQGTWADNDVEKAMKIVHNYGKYMLLTNQSWLDHGQTHFKLLDAYKKEFKCLRSVWMSLRDQVSSHDELDMATLRLRVRLPDELKLDPPVAYIIEECELEQNKLKQLSDKIIGENDLKKRLGQLVYLKNLSKCQSDMHDGNNPEPCPICQRPLGTKWSVLQCGHCYCLECIRLLLDTYSHGAHGQRMVKCAMCREKTHQGMISYVSTRPSVIPELTLDGVSVQGSHSTKVEAVVRCLKNIHSSQPDAKALVFSTWVDMLDVIGRALQDNNIPFRSLHSHNTFQANLSSFRQNDDVMVLLLPIHSGANGLNLTEATHVLLVEPILNPGQELQAIGRVHRIGQARQTTVHHFLVKHTIEEKIHNMLQTLSTHTSTVEENTMTIGHLASLFTDQDEEHHDDVMESDEVAPPSVGLTNHTTTITDA